MPWKLAVGIVLILATGACDKRDMPALMSREDKELLDQIKAKEKSKAEFVANPSKFLNAGNWDVYDKGIINSYSRATAIEFTNHSQFDVSDLEGRLTYMDENGHEMATVPFKAEGDVRAGETKKLMVSAGEITGASRHGRILVEKLRILGG